MRLFSLALSALSLVSTMSVSSVLAADVPKGPKITNIVYFDIKVSNSIRSSLERRVGILLMHSRMMLLLCFFVDLASCAFSAISGSLCRYACFSICDASTQHGDQDLGRITMVSIYEHPNTQRGNNANQLVHPLIRACMELLSLKQWRTSEL